MISATTLAIISSYIMVLGNKKIAQPYSKVSYHPKFSLGSRFSFHSVSLQLSCSVVSDSATSWTAARQACLSITNSGACSDSCPLSSWYHPTISSSVVPFSSYLQSFPASGSFPMTLLFASVQFSSVTQLCLTLCDPMNHSMPGLPVHHQLLEFTQTHVHRVGDAIQPSHPLSSPSTPAFDLSQHQSLFHWDGSSHQVAKVLELQLQRLSFQWIFRTNFL